MAPFSPSGQMLFTSQIWGEPCSIYVFQFIFDLFNFWTYKQWLHPHSKPRCETILNTQVAFVSVHMYVFLPIRDEGDIRVPAR